MPKFLDSLNLTNRAPVYSGDQPESAAAQGAERINAEHPAIAWQGANRTFGGVPYHWDIGMQVWVRDNVPPPAPEPTKTTTDVITGQTGQMTDAQQMVHSQTARTLEALRQTLNRGQNQSGRYLREGLAQRGMLDSGSLGAGLTRIAGDTQSRLAAGTQSALTGETQALLDLLSNEKNRQWQERMMREGWANQAIMNERQIKAQKDMQPKWYESLLQGAGGSLPPLAMMAL